ncbi:suppressor of fused domain protein [Nocardioides sp.]|uniref:suppressor of fused domain protein n=1 Tax=Nocardioides sp. TaxID=35761 RepID=UPI002637394B|nr:suppressor of fused domain protein [Nocardioides sp.]
MTADGKTIARTEAAAFGGTPRVHRYSNDAETLSVNILSAVDGPQAGVTSYGTVDLSTFDNGLQSAAGKEIRVEILSACASTVETFGNIVMACALNVASGRHSLTPGVIHPRTVELYEPEVTMKHMLLVPPFLWGEDALTPLEDDEAVVLFLQGVPISDAELQFAEEHGTEALEDRFVEAQIDVFDLNRPSVV